MPELTQLLDEFERNGDPGRKLRGLLEQVPSLRRDLEKAASDGALTAIRYADTGGTNGTYDPQARTLNLSQALKPGIDRGDADSIIALAYVAGHEGSHASRGGESLAHTAQLKLGVQHAYVGGEGVRDYTALAGRHIGYLLREEALAEIGGFNAAVAATQWIEHERDFSDTLQTLTQKGVGSLADGRASVALGQISQYIESEDGKLGATYRLKGGVEPNREGLLNPADHDHVAFMRQHFSDRQTADPTLNRYYRHVAAADVVRLAIGAGSSHAEVGLDMSALGVDRQGFADKFRSPEGHVVRVGFIDVKSAVPLQPEEPRVIAQDDGSSEKTKKRARSGEGDGAERAEELAHKRLKPVLNESLLAQARQCLTEGDCPEKLGSRGIAGQSERIAVAAAVAAQNDGFSKVGAIGISGGGQIWVFSADKDADYSRKTFVGYDKSLARKDEEQHLENLKAPPVESVPPPQIGGQHLGGNPKHL